MASWYVAMICEKRITVNVTCRDETTEFLNKCIRVQESTNKDKYQKKFMDSITKADISCTFKWYDREITLTKN